MKKIKILNFKFILFYSFLFLVFPGNLIASNLTVHFTGMSPHLNENLYLRVWDKGSFKETSRTQTFVTNADFDIVIDAVETGRSYYVDFFADHNSNGFYDGFPTDHTWRLSIDNAAGDGSDELSFPHNTNFTDIDWDYLLTVHFTGMSPHLNQTLQLRVEDTSTGNEIGRIKIDTISSADFDVNVPGIKLNGEYKVQFFADHNGNGLYDSAPTDHTWEIDFTNDSGDVSLDFAHNTNFTEINWKYLLTVNFLSMSPHLGEFFELRVVDVSDQTEVGRVSIDSIFVQDFTINIPGIELNKDYNIDFYADHNLNGKYDPPPADHTWRITFNSANGDFTEDFMHNTNFTDIEWPGATSVEQINSTLPEKFSLSQNYPNPFNPSTTIEFNISKAGFTTLKIYNLIGEEVDVLLSKELNPGTYKINWQPSNLTSGAYFYRLEAENYTETKDMIYLK